MLTALTKDQGKLSTMPRVLVVEDELTLAQTIELYLRKENFSTERATDGEAAIKLFRLAQPDLVILDLGLPKLDGLEVLKRIRSISQVPVIILTARAEEIDEILGLGLGADDYIVKPASARKLMARVKAVLRRGETLEADLIRLDPLEIDRYSMQVKVAGEVLKLTPTEFRLLLHLAETPQRAISRTELFEAALPESDAYERAVDIHLTNLRRKLSASGIDEWIQTVRGIGYRLEPPKD